MVMSIILILIELSFLSSILFIESLAQEVSPRRHNHAVAF